MPSNTPPPSTIEGLVCDPTASSKPSLQSRFGRGLRGSLRSSTRKSSATVVHVFQRHFASHKNLQPVHEDFDDFHIITEEDLLLPALPPTTIDFHPAPPDLPPVVHKGVPRLQVETTEGIFVAPHRVAEPESATTPLSVDRTFASDTSGPSELGDIAKNFPPPPSFIPYSTVPRTAQSPANPPPVPAPAPLVIERAQSNAGTARESLFSLSRFKTGVKRILRVSLRLPSFRKSSPRTPIFDPSAEAPAITAAPQSSEFLDVQTTRRSLDNLSLAPLFHKYEFVDPNTLTASPPPQPTKDLIPGSTRSTFIPPSPSWIVSKATELEANSRQPTGIGLSFEADPQAQKLPTLSLPIPTRVPSSTTSPPLSPLEVHEDGAFSYKHELPFAKPVPIASRSSSANSKLSFATANTEFSTIEGTSSQPAAY